VASPYPQLQGCSSSVLGRRVHRVGARFRVGSGPLLPLLIRGEGRSPPMALSAAASLAPRPERPWCCFRCLLPPLGWSVAAHPPRECQSRRARVGHAQVLLAPPVVPGCRPTRRMPRGQYSCSGTASARTGVRTCRCALGRPTFTGAVLVVVAIGEASFADETIGAIRGRTSGSLASMACPRPSCAGWRRGPFDSSVCPEAITATV
jgi:hypothetical protein